MRRPLRPRTLGKLGYCVELGVHPALEVGARVRCACGDVESDCDRVRRADECLCVRDRGRDVLDGCGGGEAKEVPEVRLELVRRSGVAGLEVGKNDSLLEVRGNVSCRAALDDDRPPFLRVAAEDA